MDFAYRFDKLYFMDRLIFENQVVSICCVCDFVFVWSSGIGGIVWPVVGPQQIYESLQHDRSRCFNFWFGGFVLVVSRDILLRDKLYFSISRLFQVMAHQHFQWLLC